MIGDDIRGVQLTECFKDTVIVCNDGEEVGGSDDGAVGGSGGDDIRGVQRADCCKHVVSGEHIGCRN